MPGCRGGARLLLTRAKQQAALLVQRGGRKCRAKRSCQTLRWSALAHSAPLGRRSVVARDSVATPDASERVAEFITIISDIRVEFR
jgi:hypothetical protein